MLTVADHWFGAAQWIHWITDSGNIKFLYQKEQSARKKSGDPTQT